MKMINYKIFIVMLTLIAHVDLLGVSYGSDTQVKIESYVSFPETDTNNQMLGFSAFANGFALNPMNTTCTFNDFWLVGGPVSLNGSTLILQEDLILSPGIQILTGGTINAHNHAIIMEGESTQTIPLSYGINFITQLLTPGSNLYSVDWSTDNKYIAGGTGGTPRLMIYSFNGLSPAFTASANLGSTIWALAWQPVAEPPYYLVTGANDGLRAYQFTPPSSLVATYTVGIGTSETSVAWHPSGNIVATCHSNAITIYNFIAGVLTYNTSYSFLPGQTVNGRSLDFDYTGSYLAAGVSTANQLQVLYWDGLSLTSTASANTGGSAIGVNWSPDGSLISFGTANILQVYRFDRTLNSLTLWASNNLGATITSVNSTNWRPDGSTIAVGSNRMYSIDYSFQLFAVNQIAQQLLLIAEYYQVGAYNTFECRWSPNSIYLAVAQAAGLFSVFILQPSTMTFNNAVLQFSGDTYLNAPLLFQGTSVLDGKNNALYLGSFGGIIVDSGASLLLKDLTVYNVSGTNVRCVDNTSTLSCFNVTWHQDNNVTFSQGQLAVIGQLVMTGSSAFIYQSDQTSTIYDLGTWYFDNGMTFSYSPIHGANNLIAFQDAASILHLYGTNLYAPSTGLCFTKGCLMIEGPCQFISDGADAANGIWLGDGTGANDLKVKILPESGIIPEQGYVLYKNSN